MVSFFTATYLTEGTISVASDCRVKLNTRGHHLICYHLSYLMSIMRRPFVCVCFIPRKVCAVPLMPHFARVLVSESLQALSTDRVRLPRLLKLY